MRCNQVQLKNVYHIVVLGLALFYLETLQNHLIQDPKIKNVQYYPQDNI